MTTPNETLLTRVELAKHFNISTDRVQQYVSLGLPVAQKGKQGKAALYDLAACEAWVAENIRQSESGSLAEVKLRKLTAEAELAEIKRDVERGRLIEIDAVAREVEKIYSSLRAKLGTVPSKASGIVHGMRTPTEIKVELEKQINYALNELTTEFIEELQNVNKGSTDQDDLDDPDNDFH